MLTVENSEVAEREDWLLRTQFDLVCHLPVVHSSEHIFNVVQASGAYGPSEIARLRPALARRSEIDWISIKELTEAMEREANENEEGEESSRVERLAEVVARTKTKHLQHVANSLYH